TALHSVRHHGATPYLPVLPRSKRSHRAAWLRPGASAPANRRAIVLRTGTGLSVLERGYRLSAIAHYRPGPRSASGPDTSQSKTIAGNVRRRCCRIGNRLPVDSFSRYFGGTAASRALRRERFRLSR